MPIKKIKKGFKKVKRAIKATPAGIKHYAKTMDGINKEAEKSVGKSGSRNLDIKRAAREANRLKKKRGVTLKNSIKKKMK